MSLPIEDQIRQYFAQIDEEQPRVDLDALPERTTFSDHSLNGLAPQMDGPVAQRDLEELELLTNQTQRDDHMTRKRSAVLLLAAALALVAGIVIAGNLESDDSAPLITDQPDETIPEAVGAAPDEVLAEYFEIYRTGDLDAIMTFFSEDSVIIDHPVEPDLDDLESIRRVIDIELKESSTPIDLSFSNAVVSTDRITWDDRWVNRFDEAICAEGHQAEIVDGRFVSWTYPDPDNVAPCVDDG